MSGLLEEDHDEEHDDGHDHIEGFNEHVWYSFHAMEHLAEAIAHELADLDADNAAVYEANYEAFAGQIEELEERAEELRALLDGTNVAITEPVPLYLLAEVGLNNITPSAFIQR